MRGAWPGRRVAGVLLALFAFAAPVTAEAQPYAAAEGWARPVRVPGAETAAATVAAAWPTTGVTSGPTVVWADQGAVWAAPVGAAGVRLAGAADVRSLSAGSVDGELVVAWARRDRNTGLNHHLVWRRGVVTELFTDPIAVEFGVVTLGGAGYLAATLRRGGAAELTLIPLDGGEARVFHRTPLSVRGLTLAPAEGGGLWAAWLEGKSERTEFGVQAEWHPYAATLSPEDPGEATTVALGSAEVSDERQRAVIAADPGGAATVMWTDEEGGLMLSELRPGAEGGPPVLLGVTAVSGAGRPVAASWPYFYWTTGTSFVRIDATAAATAGADPVTAGPRNVLWSPTTVEGAAFAPVAANGTPGGGVMTWYGRAQGGGVELYASDDTEPMRLTLADRLSGLMGWNPWFAAEQAIGQALTSLLVGVLGVLAAVPYLLLTAPLTARALRGARRAGARRAGLALGALPVLAAATTLAATGVHGPGASGAAAGGVAVALALGLLAGELAVRGGDREVQATVLLAAATTVFASVATWSFVSYPAWAPLVGLT